MYNEIGRCGVVIDSGARKITVLARLLLRRFYPQCPWPLAQFSGKRAQALFAGMANSEWSGEWFCTTIPYIPTMKSKKSKCFICRRLLEGHSFSLSAVPNLYRTSHRPRSSPVRPDLWNQPNIPEMDPSLDPSQLTLGRSAS